jgi:hypothetical protein
MTRLATWATTMTRPFPRRHDCETNGNRSVRICHMGYPMDGPGFQCDPFSCVMFSWIHQRQGTTNTHTHKCASLLGETRPHPVVHETCLPTRRRRAPTGTAAADSVRAVLYTYIIIESPVGWFVSCHPGYSVDGSDPIVAGTTARRLH